MRKTVPLRLIFSLFPISSFAQQTEIEPNEDFTASTNWTYGQTMSGTECLPPASDADHFRIVLPTDGVINFTVTTQGSGTQPGTLQFALFPKYGIYQQYHTLAGDLLGTTVSFSHSCLSGDTMYVRMNQADAGNNSCISYEMSCTVTPTVFANDVLPNDDFANPQPVALGTPIEGHMNFLYDNTSDHYGVTLPSDGVLRIIAEAEHADTATDGAVQLYVNVDNSYHYPAIGANGVVATDTFYLSCFAAQLVTIRVQNSNANTCGVSYRLRFDHTPHLFANDPLPNDDFANPQPIALNTPIEGHLDHYGETTADHYGLTLPDDGTLLIIAEAEQYGPDTTGAVEVYVNMNNSYAYVPIGANATAGLDTFRVECLRAGNVTVRLQPNTPEGCGISYRVRFELIPSAFGNDPEPNEGAADATVVAPDTDQDGHLAYIGTSTMDHYKLWKGFAGTMRVIISSTTEGPSPAINLWTLNANVNENVSTGENGDIVTDTVLVTTANPDTILLRVSAVDFSYCGSYHYYYESGPMGLGAQLGGGPMTQVFPNPSISGRFTVHHSLPGPIMIAVQDAQGSVIYRSRAANRPLDLDLSHLPSGLYVTHLMADQGSASNVRLMISGPENR